MSVKSTQWAQSQPPSRPCYPPRNCPKRATPVLRQCAVQPVPHQWRRPPRAPFALLQGRPICRWHQGRQYFTLSTSAKQLSWHFILLDRKPVQLDKVKEEGIISIYQFGHTCLLLAFFSSHSTARPRLVPHAQMHVIIFFTPAASEHTQVITRQLRVCSCPSLIERSLQI